MKPTLSPDDQQILDALQQAVAAEPNRKGRLGHYVVLWHEGRAVLHGPDAPQNPATVDRAGGPVV